MFQFDPNEGLTSFTARLLDTAARAVVDLARENLYVIETALGHASGVYLPAGNEMFEPELRDSGKWHGPGLVIVMDGWKIFGKTLAAARAR